MKRILLVCAAGMSTSLLVNKMNDAAKDKGIEVDIEALAVSSAEKAIAKADVVLLGPQVRFQKAQVDKIVAGLPSPIPVDIIDMRDYGTMNGKAVLEKALSLIG